MCLSQDDANVPSLLSLPYLGYTNASDAVYIRTRTGVLSTLNPYYFNSSIAEGIGFDLYVLAWISLTFFTEGLIMAMATSGQCQS